jgi:hypothetical protein
VDPARRLRLVAAARRAHEHSDPAAPQARERECLAVTAEQRECVLDHR